MYKLVVIIFFILLVAFDVNSQCAMCKSVVESNLQNGDSIGKGLNDGILYLMAMPYICLLIITFLWFRHNRSVKNNIK